MGNHCACIQVADGPDAAGEDPRSAKLAARNAKKKDMKQQKVLLEGKENPQCVKAILKDISSHKTAIPCVGGASWEFRAGAGGSGNRGNLTGADMGKIADRLSDSTAPHSVRRIDLVHRGFSDGAADAIARIISSRPCAGVSHISVSHNNLTDAGAAKIFSALLASESTSISTLLMDGNAFGSASLEPAGEALEANTTLSHFELCLGSGHLPVPSPPAHEFFRAAARSQSLKKIRISGENARCRKGVEVEAILQAPDLVFFFARLAEEENARLEDVSLTYLLAERKDQASEAEAMSTYASFAASLMNLPSIKQLDLTGNMMSDRLASALSDVLSAPSCGLAALNLSRNNLTSVGLAALGAGLAENATLKTLNISNQFSLRHKVQAPQKQAGGNKEAGVVEAGKATALLEAGIIKMFTSLKGNTCLEAVVMTDIEVTDAIAAAVLGCLEENRSLVDIRYASCGGEAQARITQKLRDNQDYAAADAASAAVSSSRIGGSAAQQRCSCPDAADAVPATQAAPQLVFKETGHERVVSGGGTSGAGSRGFVEEFNNTDAEQEEEVEVSETNADEPYISSEVDIDIEFTNEDCYQ